METASMVAQFKDLGVASVLVFSAIGSCLGVMAAGLSAVGAWKKGFIRNKPAPFIPLLAFIGAPLSQTFYGMILMNKMAEVLAKGSYLWVLGALAGMVIGLTALFKGRLALPPPTRWVSQKKVLQIISPLWVSLSLWPFLSWFSRLD